MRAGYPDQLDYGGIRSQVNVYNSDWMAEWSKALVLGTSLFGGVGSNPTSVIWGISSIGRVRRSQRRGTGIEARILHFNRVSHYSLVGRALA